MDKKILLFIVIALLVLGGFYFINQQSSKNPISQNSGKVAVATSFYPLYFFSSQIGGDRASVTNITPAGAEPHDYEPTTQDIAKISTSQMLVLNGGVEAWGDKIKENLAGKKTKIVIAGEGLLTRQLTEEGQTSQDPHVWLSPQLAKKEASKIAAAYEEIDPANFQYYKDNEAKLDSNLDQLDSEYKKGLASCQKKDIITSHAAFGYLTSEFGLNQVAIAGLSPDAEPSSQQLADVTDFAKKNNVKYIFFESLISPKLSDTIAGEVGAKTLVLNPLEGLSDEDLKSGKDYFLVMRENLANLRTALECS